jgi:hypothetical protein
MTNSMANIVASFIADIFCLRYEIPFDIFNLYFCTCISHELTHHLHSDRLKLGGNGTILVFAANVVGCAFVEPCCDLRK